MEELQASNLALVPSQLEQAGFRDQIPHDNVRILGTTRQPYSTLVKSQDCDSGFVTIEADDDGRRSRIPYAYASVGVAHSEDIRVDIAPAYYGNFLGTGVVAPPAHEFALLYIPAQHFLVGGGVCASGACDSTRTGLREAFGGPYNVGSGSRDHAESIGLLILATN